MRWPTLFKTYEYYIDLDNSILKRVTIHRRFLWIPESYNGETRWLEWADIVMRSTNIGIINSYFISTYDSWLDKANLEDIARKNAAEYH